MLYLGIPNGRGYLSSFVSGMFLFMNFAYELNNKKFASGEIEGVSTNV
jgi:hypothetical protein